VSCNFHQAGTIVNDSDLASVKPALPALPASPGNSPAPDSPLSRLNVNTPSDMTIRTPSLSSDGRLSISASSSISSFVKIPPGGRFIVNEKLVTLPTLEVHSLEIEWTRVEILPTARERIAGDTIYSSSPPRGPTASEPSKLLSHRSWWSR